MADHVAARATRSIQAWLAADPDGSAKAIVAAQESDKRAAGALHDDLYARLVERNRGSGNNLAADLLIPLLEAVDWTALVRWVRTGEELDDADID
jgi:hypothetical protein